MPAVAGYLTKVRISGTPVGFIDEAMSVVSGNTYRINDATKEVWDPGIGVTFEDFGVPIPASEIAEIDHMFGLVTFNVAQTGPVTVTGSSVPLTTVAGAFTQSMDMQGAVLDSTTYADAQANNHRTRSIGIITVDVTLERYHDVADTTFFDAINNRTLLMLEIQPGGTGDAFRGWYYLSAEEHTGDVESLEQANISCVPGTLNGKNFSILLPG